MKILLIGEYSRLHNSLKEGLQALGHEVVLVGLTDGFKKLDVDIEIKNRFDSSWAKKLKILIFKIFKIDLHSVSVKRQIYNSKTLLKSYDIVQFINESSFLCQPKTEQNIFDFIKTLNKSTFLLSCGTDYISVNYANNKKFRYSILTPLFENKVKEKNFQPVLKYLKPSFKKLHQHIYNSIDGVISSDLDYHIPLQGHKKYLGMIPNPININKIQYIQPNIDGKIKIFHGINTSNYYKKGNDFFEKVLEILSIKYPNKIEIVTTKSVPYNEYIKLYDECHILLDMVYAYDQGYNALEAMAKGKVVFTGAEQEWLDYYQLEPDTIAINALPEINYLAEKLSWLIENPNEIIEISKNARAFIEREHHYVKIAENYLAIWNWHVK
uniref:glycosyltransferase n=1 Tax=Gelidibacter sp. TaxID=2018083 RepID=UPI00404999A5